MRLPSPLLASFLLLSVAFAAEEVPSLAPAVDSISPRSVGQGQTVQIEIHGQNLKGSSALRFFGKGLTATEISSSDTVARFRITAGRDAEVGAREFHLATPRGTYLGVFHVSPFVEINEVEPNDNWRKPQHIQLPALVNGVLKAEDWDHYGFHADAGETLVFEVNAARSGSRLDSDLALLDTTGIELAWNDDYTIYGDPHIEYTFAKAGEYIIRVGSFTGNNNADYRLIAGRVPYLRRSMPAGFSAGVATEVTLTGTNLASGKRVWLGDHLAEGKVLSAGPGEARIRLTVPRSVRPGRYSLHYQTPLGETPIPLWMEVSDVPEITVSDPPAELTKALPVHGPLVVNGALVTPRASHYFAFNAAAGERFVFRCDGQRIYYHTDPTITVLDATGKKLAFADDPGIDDYTDEYQADPTLTFIATKPGKYYVAVRDAMYRGGPDLIYRLTITPTQPDFSVDLFDPVKSAYLGQTDRVQLRVRRRAGWNTPIEVWAENLPPGVTAEKQTVEPKDTVITDGCNAKPRAIDGTTVYLPLRVTNSQPGTYAYVIHARGTIGARTVEHTAIVRYHKYAAGFTYGPTQGQQAELTVSSAPRVLISAPESVSVTPGGSATVKIGLRRFQDAATNAVWVRAQDLPAGVTIDPVEAQPGQKDVKLKVSVTETAAAETPIAIEVEGERTPLLVKVQMKKGL